MRLLIQRVSSAQVDVDGSTVGQIKRGLLVLVGLAPGDSKALFPKVVDKLSNLRIFSDDAGNMNLSVSDVGGGILLVSQFTLYGSVKKGRRPSFTDSMPPAEAEKLYGEFVGAVEAAYSAGPVQNGQFGAMMQVHLVNDGPVTFWLDTRELGWHAN